MQQILENLESKARSKAGESLAILTKEEAKSWYAHPATQYLIHALRGDMFGMLQDMQSGVHAKESAEHMALATTKLLARSQTVEEVLSTIEEIREGDIETDVDAGGA